MFPPDSHESATLYCYTTYKPHVEATVQRFLTISWVLYQVKTCPAEAAEASLSIPASSFENQKFSEAAST